MAGCALFVFWCVDCRDQRGDAWIAGIKATNQVARRRLLLYQVHVGVYSLNIN